MLLRIAPLIKNHIRHFLGSHTSRDHVANDVPENHCRRADRIRLKPRISKHEPRLGRSPLIKRVYGMQPEPLPCRLLEYPIKGSPFQFAEPNDDMHATTGCGHLHAISEVQCDSV